MKREETVGNQAFIYLAAWLRSMRCHIQQDVTLRVCIQGFIVVPAEGSENAFWVGLGTSKPTMMSRQLFGNCHRWQAWNFPHHALLKERKQIDSIPIGAGPWWFSQYFCCCLTLQPMRIRR
jgi:hypothetical protein